MGPLWLNKLLEGAPTSFSTIAFAQSELHLRASCVSQETRQWFAPSSATISQLSSNLPSSPLQGVPQSLHPPSGRVGPNDTGCLSGSLSLVLEVTGRGCSESGIRGRNESERWENIPPASRKVGRAGGEGDGRGKEVFRKLGGQGPCDPGFRFS